MLWQFREVGEIHEVAVSINQAFNVPIIDLIVKKQI